MHAATESPRPWSPRLHGDLPPAVTYTVRRAWPMHSSHVPCTACIPNSPMHSHVARMPWQPPRSPGCHGDLQGRPDAMATSKGNELWYGPYRVKYLGPFSAQIPSYLNGEFPGDYGWDTAGLSADPEAFARNRALEVIHGRWAMLGTLGCITAEVLEKWVRVDFKEPVWFKVGAQIFSEGRPHRARRRFPYQRSPRNQEWQAGPVLYVWFLRPYHCDTGQDNDYPETSFNSAIKVQYDNSALSVSNPLASHCHRKGPLENLLDHLDNPAANNAWVYATKFVPGS
ncbi:Chlorophyll a-b binding protein of LHCII type III [Hibiscus syriacus]|uniref:Chlorophyll a-b binding protein, chloroplastic n=1 Tax=Hibiscus syriacus TaxID=106335 RepID=A0A6A2XN14_HIBSY|nr:Chlorophyll a-b binding protein of LHCII type III [Hibiscus syriacus]